MKQPFVAFLLSFFLPGAGLAYLGRWKHAALNFGGVLAVGVVAALLLPEEWFERGIRYLSFGLAGGSAAYAQAMAKVHNDKVGASRTGA